MASISAYDFTWFYNTPPALSESLKLV